jgi:hypothetical protein
MNISINTEIFKFVEKVEQREPTPNDAPDKKVDLKGNEPIIDLGEVQNFCMEQFDEFDYSIIAKFKGMDGKMIGLNKENFIEFKTLVSSLLFEEPFSTLCDLEFLIDKSFNWLIDVYVKKKAELSLSAYLLDQVNEFAIDHHLFFKITPLSIEEHFDIGNVKITFFKEEQILQYYQDFLINKPETSLEEFKEIYKHNFDGINAHIKIKGVLTKAEEIAKRKVELAIDVLKCFCIEYAVDRLVQVFDLDYKLQSAGRATFLDLPNGEIKKSTLQIRNYGGIAPIDLSLERIKNLEIKGLQTFSSFIKHSKDNELYDEITIFITQLASIAAAQDNYEKVVKAISLAESILVSKSGSGKAKGLTKIKKVIPLIINDLGEQELLVNCFVKHYEIRDKYLHHYIRLPLDKSQLIYLLKFERLLILNLIELNKTFETINQIHEYFDINNRS